MGRSKHMASRECSAGVLIQERGSANGPHPLQHRDCCAGRGSWAAVMGMLMPRGMGAGSSSPCCDSSRRLRTMPWI